MTGRRFVLVCANAREREEVRRLGIFAAGFEHVELLILGTAEQTLRGMRVHEWAITEAARADWRAERVGWTLERLRIREERPLYRLEAGEQVITAAELEERARPFREVIQRFVREQLDEALDEDDTPAEEGA